MTLLTVQPLLEAATNLPVNKKSPACLQGSFLLLIHQLLIQILDKLQHYLLYSLRSHFFRSQPSQV